MRPAAFVQLGCICLHPTPNATGIHIHTTFHHQLRDMFVRQRISEIPSHAQNDHFSRVLAPLERIVWSDRHGLLPYQFVGPEVRNGTQRTNSIIQPSVHFLASPMRWPSSWRPSLRHSREFDRVCSPKLI